MPSYDQLSESGRMLGSTGERIIPHCPYVAGWIKRHEEYDDITDWPAEDA